jgi:hypothetical protein
VNCDGFVSGDVPHECSDPGASHRLLVCVVKCHVAPSVYESLVAIADASAPPA